MFVTNWLKFEHYEHYLKQYNYVCGTPRWKRKKFQSHTTTCRPTYIRTDPDWESIVSYLLGINEKYTSKQNKICQLRIKLFAMSHHSYCKYMTTK